MPPEAFDRLYALTFRRVWGVLGRAGIASSTEREDLAQDVFLLAHQKLPEPLPEASQVAWLLSAAGNVARNHRRRMRNQKEMPMDDPLGAADAANDVPAEAPAPDDVLAAQQRYRALVDGMRHEQRQVFELHEIEEIPIPAVAAALNIAEGTAKTRLRLAREHIEAAATRLDARERHAERKVERAALLLPFGLGAWQAVRDLFGDAPEGAEEAVRRGVHRALAHAALMAGGAAGAAATGKAAGAFVLGKVGAGALFGSGFALGGVAVGTLVYVLEVAAPAPRAMPAGAEAEVPRLVVAATSASVDAGDATPAEAPSSTASAVTRAPASRPAASPVPTASVAQTHIDPEETALIARATVAFARRDRAGVVEALDAHARKFPRGALAYDREGIRAKLSELGGGDANQEPPRDGGRRRPFGSQE